MPRRNEASECYVSDSTSISYREALRRWVPRLLGIAPLIVFSSGLIGIGADKVGIIMVFILIFLSLILLIFYTEVSLLSDPREKPANPILLPLHYLLLNLTDSKPEAYSNPLCRGARCLIMPLLASPFSSLINDITIEAGESKEIHLPLYEKLNATRQLDPHTKKAKYSFNQERINNLQITEINGQSITDVTLPTQFFVSGGTVEIHPAQNETECEQFVFKPYKGSLGSFKFPYTITYNRKGDQRETASITVKIQRRKENLNASGIQRFQNCIVDALGISIRHSRWILAFLMQLRIQVSIAVISLLLFQTQQVKDVLLAFMLDNEVSHFLYAAFFAVILSLLLWHSSRQLTRLFPQIHRLRDGQDINLEATSNGIFANTFELLLFLLSWLSIALFTVPIARDAFQETSGDSRWFAHLLKPYLLFLIGAVFIAAWRKFDRPYSTWRAPFMTYFWWCFGIGLIFPIVVHIPILEASTIPGTFGSVAILFWGLSILLIVGTTIFRFSVASGIPLLSMLLVGAWLININRVFDNHAIRLRTPSTEINKKNSLPSLEDVFIQWVESHRSDIRAYWERKQKYPVYVVSAQGGGIYAAYHSAKALATLTDEVQGFDQHIFAISGVSGGSIGSTIYRMALKNHHLNKSTSANSQTLPSLSARIDHFFDDRDALSTILASLLFGDLTQRFFPLPVAHWDRALGLELALENRWSSKGKPFDLNASFYTDQMTPAAYSLPYLALNTTEVESGRRYVLAPFDMSKSMSSDAEIHQPWPSHPDRPFQRDLRFSTAAALSARFPIASPYGFFADRSESSGPGRRFVDGGLYDNSGAITAAEIVENLKIIAESKSMAESKSCIDCDIYKSIKIIPIAIVDQKVVTGRSESATPGINPSKKFRLFGWSAIEAVLSSREARLQKAADLLGRTEEDCRKVLPSAHQVRPPSEVPVDCVSRRIVLKKEFMLSDGNRIYNVPLGWKISCQAKAFINDQLQPDPPARSHRKIPCEKDPAIARRTVKTSLMHPDRPIMNFKELIKMLRQDLSLKP